MANLSVYPEELRSCGVDPGLAWTGMSCLVRTTAGTMEPHGLRLLRTEPLDKKEFAHVRASADDLRRLYEIWDAVEATLREFRPHCVGVEVYSVFEPKDAITIRKAAEALAGFMTAGKLQLVDRTAKGFFGWLTSDKPAAEFFGHLRALNEALKMPSTTAGRGQAAKTMMAYSAVAYAARSLKIPVYPHLPSDLKYKLGGKRGGSKADTARAVYDLVPGLEEAVNKYHPAKTNQDHITDACGHAVLAIRAHEETVQRLHAAGAR